MGDISDFQRGQIVGACLAGASVTKMHRAAVSKVMMTYTLSTKRNSVRKPKLSERDHGTLKRNVSINQKYCSKGDSGT